MSFPLEVIYNLKCAYHVVIDMDKIINMMNIIMQKSRLKIHAYKYVKDCLSNIIAIPNIKRSLF